MGQTDMRKQAVPTVSSLNLLVKQETSALQQPQAELYKNSPLYFSDEASLGVEILVMCSYFAF